MAGRASLIFDFIIQKQNEPLYNPLDIINIKYLLSAKSLLQSLDLVHLQFLEQRTDLGIAEIIFKKHTHTHTLRKVS